MGLTQEALQPFYDGEDLVATYDSGGHHKDQKKFEEGFKRIFGNQWPCKECGNESVKGHKPDCSQHWKNKS